MKSISRAVWLSLWSIGVLFLFFNGLVVLAVDFSYLPLSEVDRGMSGFGRTVFYGTTIEDFSIEVVDVVQSMLVEESYFVIRVVDERLRRLGGISAGMSGSPIYLKGKIAGALAYSWETKDNLVGIVTPIEAMMKLWDRPRDLAFVQANPNSYLLVFGLEGRGQELIRRNTTFKQLFALPRLFPSRADTRETGELEPGSAVGIQLIGGDVDVVSIGTLTALDGDRFLAFGHPFLHRGSANYFLTSMFVNYSIEGKEFPFKVGSPIEPVGIVDEDRTAGISGRLNVFPPITKSRVMIGKESDGSTRVFHFDVIQDENIIVEFIPGVILDSIDRVLDSQIPGSSRVTVDIDAGNEGFHHEFFWVSQFDIASLTTNHLGKIFESFFLNPFVRVEADKIDLQIMITPEIREALFLSLSLPTEVKRGEVLEGTVEVHLYRMGSRSIDFTVPIPVDFTPGETEVTLRGLMFGNIAPAQATDFATYMVDRTNEIKTNGFLVELNSKTEGLFPEGSQTFYSQNISLPFVVDGTFSGSVLIKE